MLVTHARPPGMGGIPRVTNPRSNRRAVQKNPFAKINSGPRDYFGNFVIATGHLKDWPVWWRSLRRAVRYYAVIAGRIRATSRRRTSRPDHRSKRKLALETETRGRVGEQRSRHRACYIPGSGRLTSGIVLQAGEWVVLINAGTDRKRAVGIALGGLLSSHPGVPSSL